MCVCVCGGDLTVWIVVGESPSYRDADVRPRCKVRQGVPYSIRKRGNRRGGIQVGERRKGRTC